MTGQGLACDGTTLWVLKNASNSAEAYAVNTLARDTAKDISGQPHANGAGTDGVSIWFVNASTNLATAYNVSDQQRNAAADIEPGDRYMVGLARVADTLFRESGHEHSGGLWRDRTGTGHNQRDRVDSACCRQMVATDAFSTRSDGVAFTLRQCGTVSTIAVRAQL